MKLFQFYSRSSNPIARCSSLHNATSRFSQCCRVMTLTGIGFVGLGLTLLSSHGTAFAAKSALLSEQFAPADYSGILQPSYDPDRSNRVVKPYKLAGEGGNRRAAGVSDRVTQSVVLTTNDVERLCSSLGAEYRIDCLADGLKAAAGTLPSNGEYKAARASMKKASSDLRKIARKYRDKSKKDVSTGRTTRWRGTKASAVKIEKLAVANREARAVIQEAETRILRSGENSGKRRVHYQKIARAVGSTKRILRS